MSVAHTGTYTSIGGRKAEWFAKKLPKSLFDICPVHEIVKTDAKSATPGPVPGGLTAAENHFCCGSPAGDLGPWFHK